MTKNFSRLTPPGYNWLVTAWTSPRHIAIDGQSVSKSWCRAPSGAHDHIFITVWHLRSCFRGVPSLTRGQVCLLYMLLSLASAVSLGTRDYILLSQIWDFPFRRLLWLAGPNKLSLLLIQPQNGHGPTVNTHHVITVQPVYWRVIWIYRKHSFLYYCELDHVYRAVAWQMCWPNPLKYDNLYKV
jgi:hypothetical protein